MASFLHRAIRQGRRLTLRCTSAIRPALNAAVIGYGGIGPDHAEHYSNGWRTRLVAVADVSCAALAAAKRRYPNVLTYRDYIQLLDEVRPQVVSVCTWPQYHAEMVEACARVGVRGILCEKPLALRMDEVDAMLAACERRQIKLGCGFQWRFHDGVRDAATLIAAGGIGRPTRVEAGIRGSLANNGPHLVDMVRCVLKDPIAISASCSCEVNEPRVERGLPAEQSAVTSLELDSGVVCQIRTGHEGPELFRLRVEGSGGWLELTPGRFVSHDGRRTRRIPRRDSQARLFERFVRWIQNKDPAFEADGRNAAHSNEIVLAAYESAKTGVPVALPLANRGDIIRSLFSMGDARAIDHAVSRTVSPARGHGRLAADGGRAAYPGKPRTPPVIGWSEWRNVVRVLWSRQLNSVDGTFTRKLERAFADHYGVPSAVASSSGTAAIHVALAALSLQPGDEVITTPVTDMGTILPILHVGAIPVFADIHPQTGLIAPESVQGCLTKRTRALIAVHLFGRPVELQSLVELCRREDVALIEDCAQAHGAHYRGRPVGTWGDLGCFSLQQSKQITCGDGGITLINNPQYSRRAALFVDKGWNRSGGRDYPLLGLNYRMTELQAAVALAQLGRVERLIESAHRTATLLYQHLRGVPGVVVPPADESSRPAWWKAHILVDESPQGISASEFAGLLAVEGVACAAGYLPRPMFEEFVLRDCERWPGYHALDRSHVLPRAEDFPGVAEFLSKSVVLPWHGRIRARRRANGKRHPESRRIRPLEDDRLGAESSRRRHRGNRDLLTDYGNTRRFYRHTTPVHLETPRASARSSLAGKMALSVAAC